MGRVTDGLYESRRSVVEHLAVRQVGLREPCGRQYEWLGIALPDIERRAGGIAVRSQYCRFYY